MHLPSEPVTLDPALTEDDFAVKVLCNTMDGLVGYDNAGELHPKLASKIDVSADGKRYVFTLRESAKWSDGKPVTASEFVLGLTRTLDPRTHSKLANLFFPIKGARDFFSGRAQSSKLGLLAQSPTKLVIELERPASYFLHALTLAQAAPTRADVLEKNGGRWPNVAPSTGPYVIADFKHEGVIRLEPNPRYWKSGAAPRWPVVFRVIPDDAQAVALFETGSLDIVGRVPPLDLPRMRQAGFVQEFYQLATYFVAFNTRRPPFDDRDFRRAVAGAIDREGIVGLLGTASKPARSWIPPRLEGFIEYGKGYGDLYDGSVSRVKTKLAKQEQAAPVTAALTTGSSSAMVMEKIQRDLALKLGLKIELRTMDFKTYLSLLKNDTPQIYRFQRAAPFMDPIWHLLSFKGNDANNFTGWKHAEYDAKVDEAVATPPGAKREAAVRRAQRILVEEEAVSVPIFHAWQTHLVSRRLSGYRANPLNEVHYEEVSLK